MKVPRNTVASIILKCMKFGNTKTLTSADHLAKLSNRGRRDRESDGHSDRNPKFLSRDGSTLQIDNHLCSTTNQAFMVEWSLLSKRHMTACLEFAKSHLKDYQTMRKKDYLWPECKVSRLEETRHHPYGEAWRWHHHAVGIFVSDGTGGVVRIEGKM
jgi:hypothetical protein